MNKVAWSHGYPLAQYGRRKILCGDVEQCTASTPLNSRRTELRGLSTPCAVCYIVKWLHTNVFTPILYRGGPPAACGFMGLPRKCHKEKSHDAPLALTHPVSAVGVSPALTAATYRAGFATSFPLLFIFTSIEVTTYFPWESKVIFTSSMEFYWK